MEEIVQHLTPLLKEVSGYIYPNEIELHWGLLIVIYPYLTGLVAERSSWRPLVKSFNVKELQPTYRMALLHGPGVPAGGAPAAAGALGAPGALVRDFLTPNTASAMAMFGFVYAWYLMAVLLLEIWFDYRKDLIVWAKQERVSSVSSIAR